jgi:hypothetical protein
MLDCSNVILQNAVTKIVGVQPITSVHSIILVTILVQIIILLVILV